MRWLLDVDLGGASLQGAILDEARLTGVIGTGADLTGASVRGATFERCLFGGAKTAGVDWSAAVLGAGNQGLP